MDEKTLKDSISSSVPYNEQYEEPPPEESLHRGLKARQISMIALYVLNP